MSDRPQGGELFEADYLPAEGWRVISPWVTTVLGQWVRQQVGPVCGSGDGGRERALHLAEQLNGHQRPQEPRG